MYQNAPRRPSAPITSKFISIYSKLFCGTPLSQISPGVDSDRFYSDLLDLKVDRPYLQAEFNNLSKEACTGRLKPFLSTLFKECIKHIRTASCEDSKKIHAIDTISALISGVLSKNLSGWEIMEVLAGTVAQSDNVFNDFTMTLDTILGDEEAPGNLRHRILQLALTYMCTVGQLSTGAYFLQRDFYPSISKLVKDEGTEQYTFEAMLFIAILANYHKSDAARLNPYLRRLKLLTDGDFMRKVCWASNFALQTSINTYQGLSDDTLIPPLSASLGSVMTHLRPKQVLSLTSSLTTSITSSLSSLNLTSEKDKFKYQPIEASVVLLPIYEFLKSNPLFVTVLLEDVVGPPADGSSPPLPCNVVTFASYACSHASSTSSPRSLGYASLSLHTLLALVENNVFMEFMTQNKIPTIRLCRQRMPLLPYPPDAQTPICAILDCCVLWLRHNLHRRLEVNSYINCIWICYRTIWFLQFRKIRLVYDWNELWDSVIGLLNFLTTKFDALPDAGSVGLLVSETLRLLHFAIASSEIYLPSPRALHEFIYELVRSSSIFQKQEVLLKLAEAPRAHPPSGSDTVEEVLAHLRMIVDFYSDKIMEKGTGAGNAKDVMKIVANEIEANGVHGAKDMRGATIIVRSQDVLDFARIACRDVLALMP